MPMQISISNSVGGGGGNLGGGGPSFDNTYSVEYGGVTDSVSMGNVLDMANDGTDAFSVSCWYKTTSTLTNQMLVSKHLWGGFYNGWSLALRGSSNIRFWLGTTAGSKYIYGQSPTDSGLTDGSWHHVVLTYDGSQTISGFTLYIDGSSVAFSTLSNVTPSGVSTTANFRISARGDSSSVVQGLVGNIDEVGYWTSELTASDVTDIWNGGTPNDISSLSPVGWWRMGDNNGGVGTTITDQGSGGNNGTLINTPIFSTDVP